MARENQGLQIALIVSVMLSIILSVATFLCFRQYTDTAKSLKNAQDDATRKQRDLDKLQADGNQLRRYLGEPEGQSMEAISKHFDEDMKQLGAGYSQEVQFYRPLAKRLFETIQERDKQLASLKDTNQQLKNKYESREAGKDEQLKQFDETLTQVKQDLSSRTETFRKERNELTEDQKKLKDELQAARKEITEKVSKAESQYRDLSSQLKKTQLVAKKLREENTVLTNPVMDVPDGQISWVNQHNKTVWINLGRADHLQPLMTFAVYPTDVSDLGKAAKKASVEVTRILGDHLAEGRITDDDVSDPVMPGDKLHTPIWSPGDQRHFALAGIMDINGNGQNNLQLLHSIIGINGGVVDCEVDEKGKQVGDISIKTRYLVLGEKPSEKSQVKALDGYNKILTEAKELGIPQISLKELLRRMGYKPQSRVVHYGIGANPADFSPQKDELPRVSTGSVSELYQPREKSSARGAY
ncbi:MAG: hypothetical protein ACWGMZ_03695 [Thermoguttaceae bacterium]